MNIGVDIRFLDNDKYSTFVQQLLHGIIFCTPHISYTLYVQKENNFFSSENITFTIVKIPNGTLGEQFKLSKIFKKANHDMMIFFNEYKPLTYKRPYICLMSNLKNVYYQNFNTSLQRHLYLGMLEKNLCNAQQVVCLDNNTQQELIERFNMAEKHIKCIDGFFTAPEEKQNNITIDIKTKYNIKNDFFLYHAGVGIEKNYEKLIKVWKKLLDAGHNYHLVFLGDDISKNIALRNLIIEYKLQSNVSFISSLQNHEQAFFYTHCIGAIFPNLYEPFPFHLQIALEYNTRIFASNIASFTKILGNNAHFFSPISVNSIYTTLAEFLETPKKSTYNYDEILQKYCMEHTTKQFLEIIAHYDKTHS